MENNQVKRHGGLRSPKGGRPKGRKNQKTLELEALARPHAPDAINALARTLRHKNPAMVIAAAHELLDRGYGRPAQKTDITTSGNLIVGITTLTGQLIEAHTITIPKAINGSGNGTRPATDEPSSE